MDTLAIVIGVIILIILFVVLWCCYECCKEDDFRALIKENKSAFVELENVTSNYSTRNDYQYTNKGFNSRTEHTGNTFSVELSNEVERGIINRKNECQHCNRTFGSVSALQNHQRDTYPAKCRFKKYTQLRLSDDVKRDVEEQCKKADLDQNAYSKCKEQVINVLKKILGHRSNGGRFSKWLDREGSTKTGLKTRKPVEFDFTIKIMLRNTPNFLFGSESEPENNDWCIDFDKDEENIPQGCAKVVLKAEDIHRFKDCCSQGALSPTKLRSIFQTFLVNAAKEVDTNGVRVVVCKEVNGPAVKLVLNLKSHGIQHHIDVDLTPKVILPNYFNPRSFAQGFDWPRDSTYRFLTEENIEYVNKQGLYLVAKKENYWSISFANYENAVLQIISNSSTEKKILRGMKVKLEAWRTQSPKELKAVSSYILKEIFFMLRENLPQGSLWEEDTLAERYHNFVEEMKFCFVNGKLTDYFVPTTNLLDGKEKSSLSMIGHLDEELNNIS